MPSVFGTSVLAEVAGAITDLFEKLGGPDGTTWLAAFKRFLKENPREAKPSTGTAYPVTVDYDRSVEAGVAAGKYDWNNDNITSKNFPTSRTGLVELEIQLVHFSRVMELDTVIAELDKMGLRPAELHELLVFGEKYPDVQREFPVVALGSVWRDSGGRRGVACLRRDGSDRDLFLYWFVLRWGGDYRFAAVRK